MIVSLVSATFWTFVIGNTIYCYCMCGAMTPLYIIGTRRPNIRMDNKPDVSVIEYVRNMQVYR